MTDEARKADTNREVAFRALREIASSSARAATDRIEAARILLTRSATDE